MMNKMTYAAALVALGIPGLLGVTRPAKADNAPTPDRIGQAWTRAKDGVRMVAVPAGEFTMGEKDGTDNPEHQVTLDGYWIDKNLVTVAQYQKFCEDSGRKMPDPPTWGWKADHPIVNVSWDDARAYADWAGASLPTEAQWEKAARGTDGRKYPWGDEWDTGKLWSSADGKKSGTAPVGSFPEGASPYGALDMAGNVWEWCADFYGKDYYKNSPALNPKGPRYSEERVLRGDSWADSNEDNFRCAYRVRGDPAVRADNLGFRCAVRAGGN
jgi:formylglycine-generating enzyme required for sulfatase activity